MLVFNPLAIFSIFKRVNWVPFIWATEWEFLKHVQCKQTKYLGFKNKYPNAIFKIEIVFACTKLVVSISAFFYSKKVSSQRSLLLHIQLFSFLL